MRQKRLGWHKSCDASIWHRLTIGIPKINGRQTEYAELFE